MRQLSPEAEGATLQMWTMGGPGLIRQAQLPVRLQTSGGAGGAAAWLPGGGALHTAERLGNGYDDGARPMPEEDSEEEDGEVRPRIRAHYPSNAPLVNRFARSAIYGLQV